MVKLILKSPYIKSADGASGCLKYIATHKRVQIIADDRPPTRKQEQLISKLTKDFPDSKTLYEYEDYSAKPTKANASAFITLALESNWEDVHRSGQYAKYIATRPRTERIGAHGLFGEEDGVYLDKAMSELESYTGNVWTHIISPYREDAQRLGYDNAQAWRDLIRTHRNDIAAAMNIPPNDFRWYAAFHDEGDHLHIHMMAWSVKTGQAYLNKDGIRQIRFKLTNQIFQHEMLHLYEKKTVARDKLVRQARDTMKQLVREMQTSICNHPEVEQLMQNLSRQLQSVGDKKSYGYLPKKVKATVDRIVDKMEKLPVINKCYDQRWQIQCELEESYAQRKRNRPKLSAQKEFRAIKNAVIREAEHIQFGKVFFEEPDENDFASYTYWELKSVIQDDDYTLENRDHAAAQMERLTDKGDRYAQYLIGKLYRDGGLLIPDTDKAMQYFESAARQSVTGCSMLSTNCTSMTRRFEIPNAASHGWMNMWPERSDSTPSMVTAAISKTTSNRISETKRSLESHLWISRKCTTN